MNTTERIKLIKAMEYLARQINDEDIFAGWLYNGVPDGDIAYGDLTICLEDKEDFAFLCEDDEFSDLMGVFLRIMARAVKSGGLYCDGILDAHTKSRTLGRRTP